MFHFFVSQITSMVEIASQSIGATLGVLGDIHQIATDILHIIGKEHRICLIHKLSTSLGPSMRPPMSTLIVRMQPIQGQGRGGR